MQSRLSGTFRTSPSYVYNVFMSYPSAAQRLNQKLINIVFNQKT